MSSKRICYFFFCLAYETTISDTGHYNVHSVQDLRWQFPQDSNIHSFIHSQTTVVQLLRASPQAVLWRSKETNRSLRFRAFCRIDGLLQMGILDLYH